MTDTADTTTTEETTRAAGPATAGPAPRPTRNPGADGVSVGLAAVIAGAFCIMATYGELFVDALVFLAVFGGLALWAARSGSQRLRWVIAGLLALFVAINMVYAIGDLTHPESPAPFLATAIVVGAGVITIVLSVLAARGRPARGRLVWLVALGGLAVLTVASLTAAAGVEDDRLQPGDTELVTRDLEYPDQVVIEPDSSAVLIRNQDLFRHTFVVDGQVDAVELPASSAVRVELDLEPGTYRYYCDIAGHESMEGVLVVR